MDCRPFANSKYLAQRTGKTMRYWQRMAAEGKVNFATQPGGPGTSYYFDLDEFERWFAAGAKKRSPWRANRRLRLSGGAASGPGAVWRRTENYTDSPLKQKIQKLLASGSSSGSTTSSASSGVRSPDAPTPKRLTASSTSTSRD